jgi:sec-independent protein translocase protein TatC
VNADARKPASSPVNPDARMSLRDHLAELRSRMFKSAIGIALGIVVGVLVHKRVLDFLVDPYQKATNDPTRTLKTINPTDNVTVVIKLISYLGLFFGSPVWLFQVWRFITPALNPKEKRYAIPFVVSSILLFMFGAWMAIFTLPQALKFFEEIGGSAFESSYSPGNYIGLVIFLVIAFGVCFEFPVVLVALQLAGIVGSRTLLRGWRYAIVLVVVLAAVVTPSQDPYTLMFMAVPMWVFYFGAIAIGRALKK